MGELTIEPCEACAEPCYVPVDRFEQVAVREDGPTFLNRCKICGTLWNETMRYMAPISIEEAARRYPEAFSAGEA